MYIHISGGGGGGGGGGDYLRRLECYRQWLKQTTFEQDEGGTGIRLVLSNDIPAAGGRYLGIRMSGGSSMPYWISPSESSCHPYRAPGGFLEAMSCLAGTQNRVIPSMVKLQLVY